MPHQSQSDGRSLYHRWRSRSFSEVVAQEHVTRTLKNAVASGRIVHAYLFCGPRGTGKTSTARILAKAVNCLDPQQGEPCNRCASCRAVNDGRAIDLIEIDAASNRGIDDARDLREKIKYSPAEARYKVYIIDEAHMLTSEASNALLKTLEEPPEHAILILATTEAHKILPTISSRCQRFDFRRIPLQAIAQQLGMICEREGLKVERGVLDRVARMARGSLRDAESLLDQLVAYCGDEIGLEAAREVLGLTGEETVPEFAEAVRCADLARGLRLIDQAANTGADLRHFSRELIDYLRALVIAKSGAETGAVREYRAEELERLRSTAAEWAYWQLLSALRAFSDLEGRMRQEAFSQLQLEIAFMEAAMRAAGSGSGAAVDANLQSAGTPAAPVPDQPQGVRQQTAQSEPRAADPTVGAGPVQVAGTLAEGAARGVEQGGPEAGEPKVAEPKPAPALELASIRREWPRIIEELTASGGQVIGMALAGCTPMELAGNSLTLGFKGDGWRRTLERPGVRDMVEEGLGRVFGTKVTVRLKFGVKDGGGANRTGRDAVVDAAVRELGFEISRVEPIDD